MKISAIVRERK